jgi:GxxExxY protein
MNLGKVQQFGQSAKSASVEKMRDPQTYAIIGAAMEVHRVLGCGFLEPVYQEALAKEFLLRGIPFRREVELPVTYKGEVLALKYKPDFICYDQVIVELKALDKLGGKERRKRRAAVSVRPQITQITQMNNREKPMSSVTREFEFVRDICEICVICGQLCLGYESSRQRHRRPTKL